MRALIVDSPWIDMILAGTKTWEMRTRAVSVRGPFGLIRKGSGRVVGVASLDDSLPPLDEALYALHEGRHGIPPDRQPMAIAGGWRVPWVLSAARPLSSPVPYAHPRGAVTWVALAEDVSAAVRAADRGAPHQQPGTQRLP